MALIGASVLYIHFFTFLLRQRAFLWLATEISFVLKSLLLLSLNCNAAQKQRPKKEIKLRIISCCVWKSFDEIKYIDTLDQIRAKEMEFGLNKIQVKTNRMFASIGMTQICWINTVKNVQIQRLPQIFRKWMKFLEINEALVLLNEWLKNEILYLSKGDEVLILIFITDYSKFEENFKNSKNKFTFFYIFPRCAQKLRAEWYKFQLMNR